MSKRSNGMSAFRAGVLALVVVGLCTYFGFSKANPFANPYEFKAVFHDVNNLKPQSPVRIAGVEVGQGHEGRGRRGRQGRRPGHDGDRGQGPADPGGRRAQDPAAHLPRGQLLRGPRAGLAVGRRARAGRGHPGHADGRARAVRRPADRAPERHARGPPDVPARVLERARQGRRRRASTSRSSTGSRPTATRRSRTTRRSARSRTATSSGCWRASRRRSPRSSRDERALKGLVTNFNITAGALAREDEALAASIPALRDTLRAGAAGARLAERRRCRRCAPSPARRCRACAAPTRRSPRRCRSSRRRAASCPRTSCAGPRASCAARSPTSWRSTGRPSRSCARRARCRPAPTTCSCRSWTSRSRTRRRATRPRTRTRRCVPSSSAASSASRARAACRTATTSTSTPARRRPAPRVRPGPPPDGGNMPMPHRPDVPCEKQELPNLHAPGGPIPAFPVLDESPGSFIKPPAPVPNPADALEGINDFVDNVLPLVALERSQYQRGGRPSSATGGRPDDHRDPQAPRRLPRDPRRGPARDRDRRVHPVEPAAALPAVEEPFYTVKAELPDAQAVHAGPGPDGARGRRARRRHRQGRARGRARRSSSSSSSRSTRASSARTRRRSCARRPA